MKITRQMRYPNLAKQFRSIDEIAKLIYRSEKTVRRSLSGDRPFEQYEIGRIEEYTGLSREYLLRRELK